LVSKGFSGGRRRRKREKREGFTAQQKRGNGEDGLQGYRERVEGGHGRRSMLKG